MSKSYRICHNTFSMHTHAFYMHIPDSDILYASVIYPKNASLCNKFQHLNPFFLPTIRHIGQPLNNILPLGHTHNRHTGNLPNPPLQIPIIRRDQINPMFLDVPRLTLIDCT